MRIIIKFSTRLLFFLASISLQAELLIIKKIKDKDGQEQFAPLSLEDKEDSAAGQIISQIILKYEWPMCIASDLTEAEKNELLRPGKSYAEEKFIQKKIDEAFKPGTYYVVFVPTCVYELFCINEYLNPSNAKMWVGINPAQLNINLTPILNQNGSPAEIRKKVLAEYIKANDTFFEGNPSAFWQLNAILGRFLFDTVIKDDPDALKNIATLKVFIISDTRSIIEELIAQIKSRPNSIPYLKYEKQSKQSTSRILPYLKEDESYFLIARAANLEYEAVKKNKALLLRGTSVEKAVLGFNDDSQVVHVVGSTIKDKKMLKAEPYSVSFGNSLFSGFFFDFNACAYYFLAGGRQYTALGRSEAYLRTAGYALLVDKKAYIEHQNNNLLYISPLAPIASLFAGGEYFHSRSKAAISSKIGLQENVPGLFDQIKDPTGLILITRDPIKHAALFAQLLADSGRIIQEGDSSSFTPEEKNFVTELLRNQKELSTFYKTIARVVDKARSKFMSKMQSAKKISTQDQKKLMSEVDAIEILYDSLSEQNIELITAKLEEALILLKQMAGVLGKDKSRGYVVLNQAIDRLMIACVDVLNFAKKHHLQAREEGLKKVKDEIRETQKQLSNYQKL